MEEKKDEKIKIELEEISEKEDMNKIGEVCHADTGPPSSVITLKIKDRPDNLQLGQPLVIETDKLLYYALIIRLYYPPNEIAERFANSPFTNLLPPSQIEGVRGKEFYGLADLACLRLLPNKMVEEIDYLESMRGFDTIPPIFSMGRNVTPEEFNLIYQKKEHSDTIGTLRGFELEVPIDFEQLVKKPYGVFGRTGIGKSILNKLLCLFILKHQVSQLLLFDMQGEYGLVSRSQDKAKGLAFYFQDNIQIYLLSELEKGESRVDGSEPFFVYRDSITAGDIIASTSLSEPAINALIFIDRLLALGTIQHSDLIEAINNIDPTQHESIHEMSLRALRNRVSRFETYGFLKKRTEEEKDENDSVEDIFQKLRQGKSIVIDFGKYGINEHLYFFIANLITRRLYHIYSIRENDSTLPPLVVVLEEAHKFLKSGLIQHTIFDRIAREMRKFQLTLAFVDQRPSQIDEEVYSQIATSFVMHMTDEKDIKRVVSNLPESKKWKGVISGLRERQVFMRGDAIAVPSIIEIMDYSDDQDLRKKLGKKVTLSETMQKIENTDVSSLEDDD